MSEIVFLVEEDPDGGYTARALSEAIFTEADTVEQLREHVREAVDCPYEGLVEPVEEGSGGVPERRLFGG